MESPQEFSTGHLMSASSSWTGGFLPSDVLTFGFSAVSLHINNTCGVAADRVFFSLQGTATTNNDFIRGGTDLVLNVLTPTGGLSLLTTSSSSAAGTRPAVGVSAWGSA